MKNGFAKKLALALSAVMVAGSLTACGSTPTTTESSSESSTAVESEATAGADTLVVGYDYFSSKFSPFFAKTGYDMDVAEITGVTLLPSDRGGNVLLNSMEGETVTYNGTDYTYNGIANCVITQNADGTVDYDITLKDGVTFSDGEALTIDDVIFSMYVLSDPTYDGSSSFYSNEIIGMDEYRSGMESKANLILTAGRDNTDFTYFTEEEQTAYWTALDVAGEVFAQDIVDYCVAAYPDYLESCGNSEVALGMFAWGFGSPSEDATTFTGAGTGTEYTIADMTIADYWTELQAAYEGDYQTLSDTEAAGDDLFTLIGNELGDAADTYLAGVNTGESASNISGIVKTSDNSLRVSMSAFNVKAIYDFTMIVAPLHYYGSTDAYDYDNNMFGFTKGDLSGVKSVTTKPLGAGAYVFQSYENGVITFTANESYFEGAPKTKNLLFRETSEADKLAGVTSGAFDITDPSMSVAVMDSIKGYNSNGELDGDVVTTSLVDNLGYGYIGICSDNVKVGDDKTSEASRSLRKAFATMYAAYRDTVVNSYYGQMASVIQYPISNTSWAAPMPADDGYTLAYSVDVDGNSIYTDTMSDEDKYVAALDAAIGFFQAAGYTWDEASSTFTAAPEGASMSYEAIIPAGGSGDHPSFGILTAVKEALSSIGITLEINDPADSNELWAKTEAGTAEMWVAAWGATPDPDMYQTYYSSNVVGGGGTDSNTYGIQDSELDELIMAARTSADQSYRKATYKQCLEIIMDWGVEVPVYQRQNAIIFSSERVNMDTVTPDITPYYGWASEIKNIEMN